MPFGDIKTNLELEAGICKCHSRMDILLTSTGDLALVSAPGPCVQQRLILWMATPHGERMDPNIGCRLWDIMHSALTGTVLGALEVTLKHEMQLLFPEIEVTSVVCELVPATGVSSSKVLVSVMSSGEDLFFIFSPEDLVDIYRVVYGEGE